MSPSPTDSIKVIHRPDAQCFEAIVDGQRCVADYRLQGRTVSMTHTVVPPALEGRGIAGKLVNAALVWAQAQGYKVEPLCSYVRAYLERHPEWQALQA
jgi:predicted GNAT family acetyltransferase